MKKLCEKTDREFTEYKNVKVLWRREKIPSCPHCKSVQESYGFNVKHPTIKDDDIKNE